jgi:acetyltransferase-like isoleucine patch superfamily enzyme
MLQSYYGWKTSCYSPFKCQKSHGRVSLGEKPNINQNKNWAKCHSHGLAKITVGRNVTLGQTVDFLRWMNNSFALGQTVTVEDCHRVEVSQK